MKIKKLTFLYGLIWLFCISFVVGQVMALTPEGTVIGNAATATYTDEENNEYTTTSNIVQTVVLGICAVDVIVSQTEFDVAPDQELYVPIEVKNISNMTRSFNMSTAGSGYTTTIYHDTNQNGVVDTGEQVVAAAVELNMDETGYFVVMVEVPAGAADGAPDTFHFTAADSDIINFPNCTEDGDDITSTVIHDALIVANKQVDYTVSKPGGVLSYLIQFQNIGTQPARSFDGWSVDVDADNALDVGAEGILVYDELPTDTVYNSVTPATGQPSNGYVIFSADGTNWYRNTAVAAIGGDAGVTHIGFFIPDSAPTSNTIENLLAVDQQGNLSYEVTIADPFDDPGNGAVAEDEASRVDNMATVYYNDSTDTSQEETPTNWVHTIVPSSETADISLGGLDDTGAKWQFAGGIWTILPAIPGNPTWEEDLDPLPGMGVDGDYRDDNYASNVPAGSWVTFEHQVYNSDVNNDDVISLSVNTALPNLPAGSIVEFWNADGTIKLIDTDADGDVDLGTVAAAGTKDFIVKVFIPANAVDTSVSADGTLTAVGTDYWYVDVQAISGNNNAETDLSRDIIEGILAPGVDIAQRGLAGDNTDNDSSDGNTDGTDDGDDTPAATDCSGPGAGPGAACANYTVTPGDTKYYELQLVNTGDSPDTYSLSAAFSVDPTADDTKFRFLIDPDCTLDAGEPSGDEYEIVDTPLMGATTITNVAGNVLTVDNVASFAVDDTVIIGLSGTTTTIAAVDVSAKTITVAAVPAGTLAGAKLSESICLILAVDTDEDTTDGNYNIVVTTKSSLNTNITNDMDIFMNVEEVCGLAITPDHSDQLPPGGTTTYKHTVSNSGNSAIDARITITPPAGSKLNYRILDSAGAEVGGTQYDIANLAEGESQTFYVKVFASSQTPLGTIEELDITAEAYAAGTLPGGAGGIICSDISKDTTTIIDGYLLLEKDFLKPIPDYDGYDYANTRCFDDDNGLIDGSNDTPDGIPGAGDPQDSAGPCDIITYQIKYTNIGEQDAVNVKIADSIPDHTTYVPGSLHVDPDCDYATGGDLTPTDGATDDVAEYDSALGLVRFRVGTGANATTGGTVVPNGTGCISFKVRIK